MFFCRARTFIWLLGALSLCLEIYGAEPMQSRFSLVSVSRADVFFENASDPFFCEIPGGASLFSAAGDVSFSSWKLNWGAASFLSSSGEQLVSVDEFLISRIFGSVEISAGRTGYPARVADPARWLSGSFEPDELLSPVLIRSDRFELFRVSNRTSVCDFEAVFLPFSPRFASPVYNDPLFNRHGIDTKVSLIDSTYELDSIVFLGGSEQYQFEPAFFASAIVPVDPFSIAFFGFAGPDRTPARLFKYYRTDYLSNTFYLDERQQSNSVVGAGLSFDIRQPDWSWSASAAWTGGRLASSGRIVDTDGDWTETEAGQTLNFEIEASNFPYGRNSTEISLVLSYLCPLGYSEHANLPSFTRVMRGRVRHPFPSISSIIDVSWTQSLLDGGFIVCGSHELSLFPGGVLMTSLSAPGGPLPTEFGQYRRSAGAFVSFSFRLETLAQ